MFAFDFFFINAKKVSLSTRLFTIGASRIIKLTFPITELKTVKYPIMAVIEPTEIAPIAARNAPTNKILNIQTVSTNEFTEPETTERRMLFFSRALKK